MVVKGNFSVRLVEAETKATFQEHTKDGKYYAEVEPGVEYFVEIEVLNGGKYKGRVYGEVFVDGDFLGYYFAMMPGDISDYKGAWQYKDGVSSNTALRFNKPTIKSEDTKDKDGTLMGSVSVIFSEAIHQGKRKRAAFSSTSPSCKIAASQGGAMAKKFVRTEEGSFSTSTAVISSEYDYYGKGAHLDTVTIQYCTTPGLINVGILPEPPLWDRARQSAPLTKVVKVDPEIACITPTKRVVEEITTGVNGETKKLVRESDEFDLTHLDD